MSRLYGDQLQSTGRRFYFALDGAPGIITPAPAVLTALGQQPIAVEPQTVFRTPATAVLTLQGVAFFAPSTISPATAALSSVGQIPAEVRSLTIIPTIAPPIEDPQDEIPPTLITIWTTNPTPAQLGFATLEINVTQGGNIGFVSPGRAQLSLGTQQFTLLLLAGGAGVGALVINGLAPTLTLELVISPLAGEIAFGALEPELGVPFVWIDDDPAPTSPWITDAAA